MRKKGITSRIVEETAEKEKSFIDYPHLYRQIWTKEFFLAQAKHIENKFKDDQTLIPKRSCGMDD